MDRFADRRFDAFLEEGDPGLSGALESRRQSDLLSSPHFSALSPPVVRWMADGRGRVLMREDQGAANDPFGAIRRGYDWLGRFDPADRKALIRAAVQSPNPGPIPVQMTGANGERRSALIRMMRVPSTGPSPRWYGTIEDMGDWQDELATLRAALAESRDHHRASIELTPQIMWTATPEGALEEISPRLSDLTGITMREQWDSAWRGMMHVDDVAHTVNTWADHVRSGEPVDVEQRVRMRDGNYRWMRTRGVTRRDAQGVIMRWYGTLEDVHEQRLAQKALLESEERFRLAVQAARLGIWDFDIEADERTWSAELRAMLGLDADSPATQEQAIALLHPDDRAVLAKMMEEVAQRDSSTHFEATLRIYRANDGVLRWIRSIGWTTQSAGGHPNRVLVTFQDITEQREADERIRWAAGHDAMTRLPNRAAWQSTLEQMAREARLTGERFGLMLLDIDDLKRTNDSLGHDAGDALLSEFAARLRDSAPPGAMLGRLGGDEFGLISTSLGDSAALQASSAAILDAVRKPYVHNGRALDCGVSIGTAMSGEHGDLAEDLFKAADLALYASKAAGRGRSTLFHSDLRAHAQQHSSMINLAQQAVADDLITPYYQPKIDMRSGRNMGFEALLRWRHPRLGIQSPASIVAAFEVPEIAVAMTGKMLDAVVRDVGRWLKAGFDPGRVAFNASAADFMNDDFAETVLQRFARAGLSPRHFEVEVTETVFLGRGTENVERALRCFAQAGVRVALDDFGTGYASLTHIKQYPVDVLKIDRSFVSNIERDAGDAAIVDAIVKLGDSFGMEVVAEGVETERQRDMLIKHGCHIGQGYLLGYPEPFTSNPAER